MKNPIEKLDRYRPPTIPLSNLLFLTILLVYSLSPTIPLGDPLSHYYTTGTGLPTLPYYTTPRPLSDR